MALKCPTRDEESVQPFSFMRTTYQFTCFCCCGQPMPVGHLQFGDAWECDFQPSVALQHPVPRLHRVPYLRRHQTGLSAKNVCSVIVLAWHLMLYFLYERECCVCCLAPGDEHCGVWVACCGSSLGLVLTGNCWADILGSQGEGRSKWLPIKNWVFWPQCQQLT